MKPLRVWTNGKTIRRYSGQGEESIWHNPRNGYRQMYAILIDEETMQRINEWRELCDMRNSGDDHTKCPKCGEQLLWCDCAEFMADEILEVMTSNAVDEG